MGSLSGVQPNRDLGDSYGLRQSMQSIEKARAVDRINRAN